MNIGISAFLVIANQLQQRNQEMETGQYTSIHNPTNPLIFPHITFASLNRRSNQTVCESLATIPSISPYLPQVRSAFDAILRLLDTNVIRILMKTLQPGINSTSSYIGSNTNYSSSGTENQGSSEMNTNLMNSIGEDGHHKLALLRTCLACIPRLMPGHMSKTDFIEILARTTLNNYDDISQMAQQAIVNLILDVPTYRVKTISTFIEFIQKNVTDHQLPVIDGCLKTLHMMLQNWRTVLTKECVMSLSNSEHSPVFQAEGFALLNLCSCRQTTRRLAILILKECRSIHNVLNSFRNRSNVNSNTSLQTSSLSSFTGINSSNSIVSVAEILDLSVPTILNKIIPILSIQERNSLLMAINDLNQSAQERHSKEEEDHNNRQFNWDFSVFVERGNSIWYSGYRYHPTNFCGPRVFHTASQTNNNSSNSNVINQNNDTPVRKNKSISQDQPDLGKYLIHPINCILQPRHPRVSSTDVWAIILSTVSGVEFLLSACPQAMNYTWVYLYPRIQPISQFIDPNTVIAENRASSILRSSTKRPLTTPHERDSLQHLWHNYISMACSIFPSTLGLVSSPIKNYLPENLLTSIRKQIQNSQSNLTKNLNYVNVSSHQDLQSPNNNHNNLIGRRIGAFNPFRSDDSNQQNQSGSMPNVREDTTASREQQVNSQPNSLSTQNYSSVNREYTRELIKSLVNFLKCENNEIRNSVIIALGRLNPAVVRDLLDEINANLKQIINRKQENIRRRNRKDVFRCSVVHLFANMANNGILTYSESGILVNGQLNSSLMEFVDGIRVYLEIMVDHTSWVNQSMMATSSAHNTESLSSSLDFKPSINSNNNECGIDLSPTSQKQILNPGSSPQGVDMTQSSMSASTLMSTSNTSVNQVSVTSQNQTLPTSGQNQTMGQQSAQTTPQPVQNPSSSNANQVDMNILAHTRLYFVSFIRDLLSYLCDSKPNSSSILPSQMRHNLFILFSRWSACFDSIMNKFHPEHSLTGPPSNWPTYGDVISMHNSNLINYTLPQIRFAQESSLLPGISFLNNFYLSKNKLAFGYSNTPSVTNSGRFNYENSALIDYNLWFELIWTTNQAMVMILCSGPIYDNLSVDTVISPYYHGPSSLQTPYQQMTIYKEFSNIINLHAMNPQPGYIFRYFEQLINARDPSLQGIPYLFNSPTLLSQYPISQQGSQHIAGSQLACNSIFSWGLDPSDNFSKFRNFSNISSEIFSLPTQSYLNNLTEDVKRITFFENQVVSSLGYERLDYLFQQLGEEALFTFLIKNNFQASLMKWVIDNCYYSRLPGTVDACFNILYRIIIHVTNYKFDPLEQLITLVLVNLFNSSKETSNKALIMFQSIYHRYFLLILVNQTEEKEASPFTDRTQNKMPNDQGSKNFYEDQSYEAMEIFWRSIQQISNPTEILNQFTCQHVDFTLPLFSEVTMRLLNCRRNLVSHLFNILEYLLVNIELIDLIPTLNKATPDRLKSQAMQTNEMKDKKNRESCIEEEELSQDEWQGLPDDDKLSRNSSTSNSITIQNSKNPGELSGESDLLKLNRSSFFKNRKKSKNPGTPIKNKDPVISTNKGRIFSTNNKKSSDSKSPVDFTKGSSNRSSLPPNIREKNSIRMVRQREFCSAEDFSKVYDMSTNISLNETEYDPVKHGKKVGDNLSSHSLRSSPQISFRASHLDDEAAFMYHSHLTTGKFNLDNPLYSCVPMSFRISGTGSRVATEYVLNNIFYLTIHFNQASEGDGNSDYHLENIWRTLIRHRRQNLNVTLQYLTVLLSLAPTTLTKFIKKIITFIGNEKPDELFNELVHNLNTIDGINLTIEPIEIFPYFMITRNESLLPSTLFNPSMGLEEESKHQGIMKDAIIETDRITNKSAPNKARNRQRSDQMNAFPLPRTKPYRQNQLEDIQSSEFSSVEDEDQINFDSLGRGNRFDSMKFRKKFNQRRSLTFDSENGHYRRLKPRPNSIALSNSLVDQEFYDDFHMLENVETSNKPSADWNLSSAEEKFKSDMTLAEPNKNGSSVGETTKSSTDELTGALRLSKSAIKVRTMTLPYNATSKERYFRLKSRNCENWLENNNSSSNDENYHDELNDSQEKLKQMILNTNSLPPKLVSLPVMSLPISSQVTSLPNIYQMNLTKDTIQNQKKNSRMNSAPSTSSTEPTKVNITDDLLGTMQSNELQMPTNGGFKAPIKSWILGETILITGFGHHLTKYSGSWTVQNMNTSLIPLVLIMISELIDNEMNKLSQTDSNNSKARLSLTEFVNHLPMILLFTLLSVDHSRPLIQEECKTILLNTLRLSNGSHIDNLKSSLHGILWSMGQREPLFDQTLEEVSLKNFTKEKSIFDYYAERLDSLYLNNPFDQTPIENDSLLGYAASLRKNEISENLLMQLSDANLTHGQLSYNIINRFHNNSISLNYDQDVITQSNNSLNANFTYRQNTLAPKFNTGQQRSQNKQYPAGNPATASPQLNMFMRPLANGAIGKSFLELQYFLARKLDAIFKIRFSLPLWPWEALTTSKYIQRCLGKISSSYIAKKKKEFKTCLSSDNKINILNSCQLMNEFLETYLEFFFISMSHERNHSCLCFGHQNDCIVGRFSKMSLQMGISCYNRHYSLRSLQIFRTLGVHLNSNVITDILTRIIHCIGEINEDTQVYICELFLTIEVGISHLKEIYKLTPNHRIVYEENMFNSNASSLSASSSSKLNQTLTNNQSSPNARSHDHRRHSRSGLSCQSNVEEISHTPAIRRQLAPHVETSEVENEQEIGGEATSPKVLHKSNSYKPTTPKMKPQEFLTKDQLIDVLNSSFWIAICLLDSDHEFEYITGLRMLDKMLPIIYPDREFYVEPNTRTNQEFHKALVERLEKTVDQMLGWDSKFPGIFTLITRGLVNENLIDACYRVLIKSLPLLYSSRKLSLGYQYKNISIENNEKIFTQLILTFMPLLMLAWHEDKLPKVEKNENNSQQTFYPPFTQSQGQKESSNQANYEFGNWMNSSNYQITKIDPTSNQFHWILHNASILPSIQMLICPVVFQQQNTTTTPFNNSSGYGALPANHSAFTSPTNSHITPAYHYAQQQHQQNLGSHGSSMKNLFRVKNPICVLAADILSDLFTNASSSPEEDTGSSRYYHLSTILKMYANQTFNKDSIHWSKCVIFHLLEDSSPKVYSYILSTLDMYITHGPVSFHVPALHMAYWTLHKCNDFQNADLSDELSHFIHTISERFMNTCIWTEVMSFYQLVINRSSVISSIPQSMLNSMNAFSNLKSTNAETKISSQSKVNSSYINPLSSNAYGLSSLVNIPSPELEGPRIELSGKVLDHTFNISRICPLLAQNIIFYPSQVTNRPQGSFYQEPLKINYSENWVIVFMNSQAGFKNPAISQSRVKRRFQSLVSCVCSYVPADFKSPSVIFSQSIEAMDHQMSVHSSSETASVTEPSHIEEINPSQGSDEQDNNKIPYPDMSNYFNENISKINFVHVNLNAWDNNDKSTLSKVTGQAMDEDMIDSNPRISSMPNLTLINDSSGELAGEIRDLANIMDDECGTITEKKLPSDFIKLIKQQDSTNEPQLSLEKTEFSHCKSANNSIDLSGDFPSNKAWQSEDSMNKNPTYRGLSRLKEGPSSESRKSYLSHDKSVNQSRNLSICSDTESLKMHQFDAIAEIDNILNCGSAIDSSDDSDIFLSTKLDRGRPNLFNMVQMNPQNHYEEYNVDDSELVSIINNSDEAKKNHPHTCSTPLNENEDEDIYEEVIDAYQTLHSQTKNFYNDLYQPNSDSQSSDASLKDRITRGNDRHPSDVSSIFSIWKDVAEDKTTNFEMNLTNSLLSFLDTVTESNEILDSNKSNELRKIIISLGIQFNISLQRICCHIVRKAYSAFNKCAPDSDLDASWQMNHFKAQAEQILLHLHLPLFVCTRSPMINCRSIEFSQVIDKLKILAEAMGVLGQDSDNFIKILTQDNKDTLLNRRIIISNNLRKCLTDLLKLYQAMSSSLKSYYNLINSQQHNNEVDVTNDLRRISENLVSTYNQHSNKPNTKDVHESLLKLRYHYYDRESPESGLKSTWAQDFFNGLIEDSDLSGQIETLKRAIEMRECEESENLKVWSFIDLVSTDMTTCRRKRPSIPGTGTDCEEFRTTLEVINELVIILVNYCYFKAYGPFTWNDLDSEEKLNLFKAPKSEASQINQNLRGVYAYLPFVANLSVGNNSSESELIREDKHHDFRVQDPGRIYSIFMQNLKNNAKV